MNARFRKEIYFALFVGHFVPHFFVIFNFYDSIRGKFDIEIKK